MRSGDLMRPEGTHPRDWTPRPSCATLPIERPGGGRATNARPGGCCGAVPRFMQAMSEESSSELPFERLGPFQVLKSLATGGMADIYLGRNLGSFDGPETVVLKAWHPPRSVSPFQTEKTRNLLSRLLEEGRLGMRLKHPAIARSFGIMHDPDLDLYFLVQEYVHGATLSELIAHYAENDLRLPYNIILKLMIPVLEALHYAYFNALRDDGRRLRVIHRDIKPDNIMLGFDGRVQVLDFGVAKTTSLTRENTVGTMVVGTRYYMAPEQAYEPEKVGHHTDIFSTGLILYELCSLRSPFEDARTVRDFALALKEFRFEEHAEAIDERRYPGMRAVLARALAVEVSARYRAGADMANDLRELLESTPPEPRLATFARHLQQDLADDGIVKVPPSSDPGPNLVEDPDEGDLEETPTVLDVTRMQWPGGDEDPEPVTPLEAAPDARAAFPVPPNLTPKIASTAAHTPGPTHRADRPGANRQEMSELPTASPPILRPVRTLSAWDDPALPGLESDRSPRPRGETDMPKPVRARGAPRPDPLPSDLLPFAGGARPEHSSAPGTDASPPPDLGTQPLSPIQSLWFEDPPHDNHGDTQSAADTPLPAEQPPPRTPPPPPPPVAAQGLSLAPSSPRAGSSGEPAENQALEAPDRTPPGPGAAHSDGTRDLRGRFSWPSLLVGFLLGAAVTSAFFLLLP